MSLAIDNLIEIKEGLSKKKIYRINTEKISKIVIDFNNDKKEFQNFLNIHQILKKINVSIPKIYEVHKNKKLILMEDFGQNRFDQVFLKYDLKNLLKLAIDNLILINNSITIDDLSKLNKYSYNDLKKEISEFVEHYIPYKNISDFSNDEYFENWKKSYDSHNFMFSSFVHKDFEFINLFFLKNNKSYLKCGIIDFQSAFVGFVGWDLFSILENSRINFTRKYNEYFIKYFYTNISTEIDFYNFRQQYYLLNLSRQTRLLGRWVKLYKTHKNKEYLNYINSTKSRLLVCLENIKNQKLISVYKKILIND